MPLVTWTLSPALPPMVMDVDPATNPLPVTLTRVPPAVGPLFGVRLVAVGAVVTTGL